MTRGWLVSGQMALTSPQTPLPNATYVRNVRTLFVMCKRSRAPTRASARAREMSIPYGCSVVTCRNEGGIGYGQGYGGKPICETSNPEASQYAVAYPMAHTDTETGISDVMA